MHDGFVCDGFVCDGYLRSDGKKGIRNKVLVIYTVDCSSFVAKSIVNSFSDKNGNDVDVIGVEGCYDNALLIRMLKSFCRHPNVGAVLVVGHGCEFTKPAEIAGYAKEQGRLSEWFYVQNEGGTAKSIVKGKEYVSSFLKKLSKTPRARMYLSDLVVGGECGGSDFTSGLAGNNVVGRLFDHIVDNDGIAIFEETVEAIGLKDNMMKRAVNCAAAEEIRIAYDKAENFCKSINQFSIAPGNFDGGLSTIEEKSMGALVKSGSRQIQGVVKIAETPRTKGLWLLDVLQDEYFMKYGYTNATDSEGLVDLISAGAHIVYLVTGRGHVIGSPISPTIKVTGNPRTYERMADDIDFCAAPALLGTKSLDELMLDLLKYTKDICNGQLSKAEILGHKEYYLHYNYQS